MQVRSLGMRTAGKRRVRVRAGGDLAARADKFLGIDQL